MNLFPTIGLHLLSGFVLVLPIFIIRLGLARIINKDSLKRLEYFPQVLGKERQAQGVYFILNTFLLFSPILFKLDAPLYIFIPGLLIYTVGFIFLLLSTITFSKEGGFIHTGIYKISRNPMYIGFFLMFIGIGLCINSILFVVLAFINQIEIHYLILSEERWCHSSFPEEYEDYVKTTKRYFGKIKE